MSDQHDQNNQQALHELYQSLPKDMPPPALDARILHAAHQAVTEKKSTVVDFQPKPSRYVWLKPLAYAAVLVLCVSVVLRIQLDAPHSSMPTAAAPETANENSAMDRKAPPSLERALAEPSAAMFSSGQTVIKAEAESITPAAEMKKSILREPIQEKISAEAAHQQVEMSARSKHTTEMQQPAMSFMNDAADSAAAAPVQAPVVASIPLADNSAQPNAMQQEVAVMLQLHKDKKYEQLATQLKTFVAQYPGYALPPELKQYMDKH